MILTLDEHIKKAEEDAENCRQLAEWLKDYKRLLEREVVNSWNKVV